MLVSAADPLECQRVQITKDVPCDVIATFKPLTGCNQSVQIFSENGTLVQNNSWFNATPFCRFTWNLTTPLETFIYNSTIETGVITLEAEDNMLAITFVFILLAVYFTVVGFILQKKARMISAFLSYFLGLVEMMMLVAIIWINETGTTLIPLLKLNFTIMLLLGGGLLLFTLFSKSLNMTNLNEDLNDEPPWESGQNW